MVRLRKRKLENLSKGMREGGFASFRSRQNAIRFAKILRERGFNPEVGRSTGPAIDAKGRIRQAILIFRGKRRKR